MTWFFLFFFLSGFCSVLYELVWLRLAMAQFGVTTAFVSIVLSTFMAGLGAGSWGSGVWIRKYGDRVRFPPLRLYALSELLIGVSALCVPVELVWGNRLLERMPGTALASSGSYYLASGLWLVVSLVPWCACMGATVPLGMFAIRRDSRYESRRSFSYLYLANVTGAVAGTIAPLILVELYGFHAALRIGAALNAIIALSAFGLTLAPQKHPAKQPMAEQAEIPAVARQDRKTLALLFSTGLATMGLEIIWIRVFTPYIGTVVYSLAIILATYLLATLAGSRIYRSWSRHRDSESSLLWVTLTLLVILSLATADPHLPLNALARVILGVAPFSGLIGFLTPMLVDRWSGGDPDRAGRAYSVNVLGCILGPLLAGFVMLPLAGEHWSMLVFALPWLAVGVAWRGRNAGGVLHPWFGLGIFLATFVIFFFTEDYDAQFQARRVLRDDTATVIATGEGMKKRLLVNGVGMTAMTPITKMMAHLTLASLPQRPRSVLVVCFGMGSTFRSSISWGIPTTAVELVPSVPKLFTYYHPDGEEVLAKSGARIVVDDGRRYLERWPQTYNAIIIDPPPPVETAGSSLLYSEEFYAVAKRRLSEGGILQQWLPWGDNQVQSAVARALKNSFAYVRVFPGMEHSGWHYLASMSPILERDAAGLLAQMPTAAIADMMEWGPAKTPEQQFNLMLSPDLALDQQIALSPRTPALQDDFPVNEYFLLRTPLSKLDGNPERPVQYSPAE